MKKRALLSVSDKTGIIELAKQLEAMGYEIVSTGGTACTLEKSGVKTVKVSAITNFPECFDGRVKTLHPKIHGGILALRDNTQHRQQLKQLDITPIDIVAVNLYPFKETILKGADFYTAVENIDIGGPSMIRAAAKNYQSVLVLTDHSDYATAIKKLKENSVDESFRKLLMQKAFSHTASYDSLISGYIARDIKMEYPSSISFSFNKAYSLRYGENPHQTAAFYKDELEDENSLSAAKQLQGKELSFNNINDTNAALELLFEFSKPTCVAVKHANPCGVASGKTILDAYLGAYDSDPVSIFGGIVALNKEVCKKTAQELEKTFLEVIIAPSFSSEALEVLSKKQNLRLLELRDLGLKKQKGYLDIKRVRGGILVQDSDNSIFESLEIKTKLAPTKQQLLDLEFSYKVVKHTKSNAIVLASGEKTVGIGMGQTNRIDALQQAIKRAGERAKGAALASDAFFPFCDCVEAAASASIASIIQPGGSVRDKDSIDKADKLGLSMVFCGIRHFKH